MEDTNKRGYYTLKLTSRHTFPAEAKWSIFSSSGYRGLHDDKKELEMMLQQGNKTIPRDCTNLKVYMSGMKMYQLALIKLCKSRGIRLTMLWYHDGEYSMDKLEFDEYDGRIRWLVKAIRRECGPQCNL